MTLSQHGLQRLHRVLAGYVDRGELPGLVALVSRHDDTHVESLGKLSFGDAKPMGRDTIFRIASITKPITAAAAMILVEECRLRLDDSIEPWLPELANRRVLKSIASQPDDTVPARRAITVRDLLTSRMGFGSVMAMPDTYPIQKLIRDYRIGGDGPPHPSQALPTDTWLRNLGELPWLAHPGERWLYHVSVDVLGVLIARVSGQSLGTFLRERIFDPLGMKDTAFHIPAEKLARFPAAYNALGVYDGVENSDWLPAPPFESGAGGLISTVDDYFAFSRMLLNKGEQILSRPSVELMTADHLTPEQRAGSETFFGTHGSWGFGLQVDIARHELYHNPGRYGWTGGLGTTAYNDPRESLVTILLTQRLMDSPEPPKLFSDFFTAAYAALHGQ